MLGNHCCPPFHAPPQADIYTELGEFEKAADFYDKYISRMENNPV